MKIRVCHLIAGDQWAGIESQVTDLFSALNQFGDVSVQAAVFHDGKLVQKLSALGIPVELIDQRRLGPAACLNRVIRLVERNGSHLIHSHRYRENVIGGLAVRWIRRRRRISQVVTVHGLPEPYRGWKNMKMRFYQAIEEAVGRRVRPTLVAVSREMEGRLSRRRPGYPVVYIPNGLDPARVKPNRDAGSLARDLGIDGSAPIVAMAARLVPVKGPDLFLESARRILAVRPDVRFLIIGEGPLLSTLKDRARRSGLEQSVLFLGHRDDIPDLLQLVRIVLIPSRHEGLPIFLLEAMASGKPVVASSVGGIPEVIVHGRDGLLVPPEDPVAMATAVLMLLNDSNVAAATAERGRLRVLDQFDNLRTGRAVADTYRRMLS